ncbi:MAG: riboflavin synthase, partial [Candidatus Omnitrophica bacterium]|nr:riboflavin synthase [Candidatus Omnitrophota bacterium]
ATTLGNLKLGDWVNLERSLKVGDRIGGHFVTGHVDAKGRIQRIEKQGRNITLHIQAPEDIIRSLARKGSVAVDGISLTVQSLHQKTFEVGIIPHTLKETTLGRKTIGSFVNLEVDLIYRYLKGIMDGLELSRSPARLALKKLKRQGF